jgi:hypothetical protein
LPLGGGAADITISRHLRPREDLIPAEAEPVEAPVYR